MTIETTNTAMKVWEGQQSLLHDLENFAGVIGRDVLLGVLCLLDLPIDDAFNRKKDRRLVFSKLLDESPLFFGEPLLL